MTQVSRRLLPIRILLIEDNEINRQLTGEYLEHCGYQIRTLATGAEFTNAIVEFEPDLVLLDLKLPDMDGYTVLEQMQQHPDWRTVPTIVISAFAFQADQERALALGARQYLVKPIKLNRLLQVIEEELEPLKAAN
jgi:two-component system cell cycle response regulator DivK